MSVPTSFANRWQRLLSMDRDELADRVCQRMWARVDAIRYRLGLSFDPELGEASESKPAFFLSADSVPGLCELLKKRLPGQADEIVKRAERICRHQFDLLGYEGLDYGAEVDWHADRIHNKRAAKVPWYQVGYLDFDEVGDSKVTWELNRHQHLVTLAKAFRLTGNRKFADEMFRQWQHWHADNPYPIGINWASSLEVAFRSLSWIWMYFLLEDSGAAPAGFRQEWLRAMGLSGRHIETYLSTYFSPNTHLLGEAVALFFIGTLCPELHAAAHWKQRGWEIVLDEAARQVRPDGFHFEQSTYYHVYALDFFLHAAVLATINDIALPPEFERTLLKMMEALCLFVRAGEPVRFGDDDGGRLFDPRRNRAEHLLDPLATGAILFGRGDFKSLAGGLREETVWLLGQQGVAEFDRLQVEEPSSDSAVLGDAGFYFMRGPEYQLVIDAGPQGAATAGHGHADALSVCINQGGQPLLIDPGTCEYVGQEREAFRGTAAHNTLVIDGMDQAEGKGPFAWTNLPHVQAEGWINGKTFDLFVGSHDGYSRLGVTHRRWVFALKSGFWLVRDLAAGSGRHRLDLFWHMPAGLTGDSNDIFADRKRESGLRFLTPQGHGWSRELKQGSWSPAYGRKERAPVLHFSTVASLPAEFVTLMLPLGEATGRSAELRPVGSAAESGSFSAYRYSASDEEHLMIFGRSGSQWSLAPWSSDAEFLYHGRAGGRQTLVICNATKLNVGDKQVFASPQPVLRCEIIKSDQGMDVICSREEVKINQEALDKALVRETASEPAVTGGAGH